MEAVVDLGCSIAVPTQLIEKAVESIHSTLAEVKEALELLAQAIEDFVAALLKPDREKINTPYKPGCNKAVLLDKRHSVHRCRNSI